MHVLVTGRGGYVGDMAETTPVRPETPIAASTTVRQRVVLFHSHAMDGS